MGLITWIKREKKAFDEQTPTPGFTIGGGPLSISKALREYREQPVTHIQVGELKNMPITEGFMREYVLIGWKDGIPTFRKRQPGDPPYREEEEED